MNETPSVASPIEQLRQLGRELVETAEYPWSNIDSWIAKATPLVRHDWSAHFDDFQRAARKPRQYITLPGNNPTVTESQNRRFALESKNRLLSFIDGLLQLGHVQSAVLSSTNAEITSGANMYRRIGVMIGSPGDATDERQAITDAVARWNATHSGEKKIILEAVKWETHATPGLRGRPQGMINEELIPLSDCLIAVFRSRAGSPTGKDISGTMEEVREFMRQGKYVALYFYAGPVAVGSIDPDQLKAVNAFKKEIQQHGLTDNYGTVDELSAKLSHHLSGFVREILSIVVDGVC
jgi:hypothetical protein